MEENVFKTPFLRYSDNKVKKSGDFKDHKITKRELKSSTYYAKKYLENLSRTTANKNITAKWNL